MAKTQGAPTSAPDDKPTKKTTAELIYHPEEGDPAKTMWGGIRFLANVPTPVALTHCITVPIRKETVLPDGTMQSKNVETRVSLVELARNNPHFSVDGERAQRKTASARQPTDPDTYRGYAVGWISTSTSAREMDARWEAEASLRDKCGLEQRDIAWLMPFFEANRERAAEADNMGGVRAA